MRRVAVALLALWLGGCGSEGELLGTIGPDATQASAPQADAGGPAADSGAYALKYFLGADITWTQQDEADGATYYDDDGSEKPILTLLKDHGFNWIRLRTFVDPTQPAPDPEDGGIFAPYSTAGFGDLAHTISFGQEIKAAGLGFLLDFHCSDYWADPGKQIKPAAWAGDDLATMAADLESYTQNAVSQLILSNARPDMVQIGNSITPGVELSPGSALGPVSDWPSLAQLLTAGIRGVHTADPTIAIMLHIDRCADAPTSIAWIQNAISSGIAFDVFGESCYIAYQGQPGGWQSTFDTLVSAFPDLKFVMAEYNGDPSDASEITTANDIVFNLANHQGLGAFFWEPTHSGAWGPGLFTVSGNQYSTIPASIDQFDQIKSAFGL